MKVMPARGAVHRQGHIAEIFEFGLAPKQYFRRLGWSSLTMVLTRAKGILTLPLALLILGAGGYGTITVAVTLGSAIATLAVLNIPDGAARLIVGSDPVRAESRLAKVRVLSLVATGVLLAAAAVGGLAFGSYVATWACLTAAAGVVFKAGIVHMQYFQLAKRLSIYTVSTQYLASAVALPMALWLGPSGYLGGNAVVLGIAAIPPWLRMRAHTSAADDTPFWLPATRLSLQLLPASLAQWALFSIDAVLVYDILGSNPAGAYSATYSIGAIGLVLPMALATVWPQTAQRLLAAGHHLWRDALLRLTVIVAIVGALLIGLAFAAGPLLSALLEAPVYADVPTCVIWVVAGFVALSLARLMEGSLYAAGRPTSILVGYLVATGINVALNLVWIPAYGILGAAYATFASYLALAIFLLLLLLARPLSASEACVS